MKFRFPILAVLFIILMQACVPGRRFQEVQTEARECAEQNGRLISENEALRADIADLEQDVKRLRESNDRLVQDSTRTGETLRRMTEQYDKIDELNEQLMKKQSSLMSSSEAEKKELLETLMVLQNDLQAQQSRLNTLESELETKRRTLEEREARVSELEGLLSRQEEAVRGLKDRLSEALLGFADKGLTVEQRDGRVYVSLEAKLLFASGSTKVSAEGSDALISLAKAIEDDTDLGVLVEGHTDTDKILGNTAAYKDNWDLSVLRATSVVRILLDNSRLSPTRLTAGGRGEHLPVDPDDKAKNRRIEIILTPDLSELFQMIEE